MSVASFNSAHIVGLEALKVTVEVDISQGLYSFNIVGLPDKSIDESKDRIVAALKNSGLRNPKSDNHKVTVSLSPANIKKEGSHFDVPIAITYLVASKQLSLPKDIGWFVGELSLTGEILPMMGVLSIAECAKREGVAALYVPKANVEEAALVDGLVVYGCSTISELILHLGGKIDGVEDIVTLIPEEHTEILYSRPDSFLDYKDIRGQETAKRALEIAAAGGHNIALYGPPGTGKTMLARAFTGILPPLTHDQALEVTRIHSVAHTKTSVITHPPFRSPHHTSSYVSLVGGGTNPRPGEVTLAHHGVLFLDEFPEFDKKVIESLREPLEEGSITVSRAKGTFLFPASCTLVASMNPCPCGYMGSKLKRCVCKPGDVDRYARKLSGPIMDRIDIWVPVLHVDYDTLSHARIGEESKDVRARVAGARNFAQNRFREAGDHHITKNKDMKAKDIDKHIPLSPSTLALMKKLSTSYTLSPRAYHRVLRLARTIADLRQSSHVSDADILEAFQYRPKLYQDRL
ncbi:YifB family Mg chelatase-like AAA ATPase [Candidatus Gracilibacteria bacterium]|nr:YifB family Mg chelatase-like AAA ATPase [Candidatus Gracilibacteria bacterium]MCF7898648.1 YifB family Mg chelatase-like AAA ATPase [Candidatus Paceibacterota bacterium]